MKASRIAVVLVALVALGTVSMAEERPTADCGQKVSRASDAYWDQIKRCGCDSVEAVPRASTDYDRWAAACAEWRRTHAVPSASPSAAPSPAPSAAPRTEAPSRRTPDCEAAPSRASAAYWRYIDRCGCDGVEAVPRASLDYDRWASACDRWRKENPTRSQP